MRQQLSNKAKRIISAIAECERFIEKEGSRAADLRPADMQQHLEYCISHRLKLIGMLAAEAHQRLEVQP